MKSMFQHLFRDRDIKWQTLFVILICSAVVFTNCKKEEEEIRLDLEENGGLLLPDGFEAVAMVNKLRGQARHIAVRDNGDIFVKLKRGVRGHGNAVLRDTNRDDRIDIIKNFGDYEIHGRYGTAIRIHDGYLYYSSQMAVYRQKLLENEMVPSTKMDTVVMDDHPKSNREHIGKPITFDNKGHIYVPFGAPSNACQDPKRTPGAPGLDPCPQLDTFGGVWQYQLGTLNQYRTDGVKFASGIRSLVCLEWNPNDQELYTVQHGRDDLLRLFPEYFTPWQSALLPAEEFMRVTEGSDFGWPYCYYDQLSENKVLAPEYGGDGEIVGRCSTYDHPIMGFPGHWAPNDLLFYTGDQFPERYKQGAFVAFHGSTNRAPYPQSGYIIAFVPFADGHPTCEIEVFADGFARVDTIEDVSDAVFRPMGLAQGPDGSLYIAETEHGAIWKVQFKGDKENFGPGQLAAMEDRKKLLHIRTPHRIRDNLQKDTKYRGEFTYLTYCGTCHQSNGKGDSGRFPPLNRTPWVTGDKERLISVVLHGLEGKIKVKGEVYNNVMPQHSFLSDEKIAEVLTYIRKNFGNRASEITANEVRKVRDMNQPFEI